MKLITIILIFLMANILFAQQSIDLRTCYKLAEERYPLHKQSLLYQEISSRDLDNISAKYYPQINLVGQASYQSDVTKIDMDIPIPNANIDFPEIDKDQYKVGVSVDQLIWDGGIIKNSRNITENQYQTKIQNVEVELYSLRNRVNSLYFGILKLQENIKILELSLETMSKKLAQVQTAVDNGMALQSNADIITAEIMKIEQKLSELIKQKEASKQSLSTLIEKDLKETELKIPETEFHIVQDKRRPEYELFRLSKQQLNQVSELALAEYLPKFYAFGQAMYGKPGLNMFDPDFQPFFIIGLKATWNFWDWNVSSRKEEIAQIQKEIITSNEETFDKNLNIGADAILKDIEKIEELLEKDKKIIELREKIVQTASSQLDNGVITSTEYITEMNALTQAKLSYQLHKIELKQARIDYLTHMGIDH